MRRLTAEKTDKIHWAVSTTLYCFAVFMRVLCTFQHCLFPSKKRKKNQDFVLFLAYFLKLYVSYLPLPLPQLLITSPGSFQVSESNVGNIIGVKCD